MNSSSDSVDRYFRRFGGLGPQIDIRPDRELGMVVVIPCYHEPDLIRSLSSLRDCQMPRWAVEIIVVVNSAENSAAEILQQNALSVSDARKWAGEHGDRRFQIYVIHAANQPAKTAGVGLARKIGMDEAVRRLDSVGRLEGVVACFDADCLCDGNYLCAVEEFFALHPRSPGCSIYFEHPLDTPEQEAITLYELHLRYYVEGLRYAGFPHAFHTVGSSMATRARAYVEQGGMNKRKAGEDFYFLHKIIPLGGFGEIKDTRVIPSPRASDRVPFGTGRAVGEYLERGEFSSYPVRAFQDLREFLGQVGSGFEGGYPVQLSGALASYFEGQKFAEALGEIRANTTSAGAFERRFYRWFDGFRAMKFIHYARDHFYGSGEVVKCAKELLAKMGGSAPEDRHALLEYYRQKQRRGIRDRCIRERL